MSPELRRGAAFSAALHVLVGIVLLVAITPSLPPEAPQGFAVTMEFGPGAAGALGTPAPKKPTPTHGTAGVSPARHPPTPAVREPPPPPPPPPPPAETAEPQPPAPVTPAPPPPPVAPSAKPIPTPTTPTPPKTPPKPVQHPAEKPLPLPPPPAPPVPRAPPQKAPPAKVPPPPSPTHQANATTNSAASSKTLENTLEKLRALQESKGTRVAEATPGSAAAATSATSSASGVAAGDTSALDATQRGQIGAYVRRCWTYDAGAKGANKFQVLLDVVTDAAGTVRIAKVASADQARVDSNPELRAFAERAVNAALDPRCATLPLPPKMLGAPRQLVFRFTP